MSGQWKDHGGPAFPQFEVVAGERDGHGDMLDAYTTATGGMTLRDWFAGQALPSAIDLVCKAGFEESPVLKAAKFAYSFADAMIEARGRP